MKVPILFPKIFDYPFTYKSEISQKLNPGDFVKAPFGSSEITGVVWSEEQKTEKKFKLKNIDDYKVFSTSYNPLNVQKDLLDKINFSLEGLYFYHFHYLPPVYENYEPENFRRESWKLENPLDTKGYFLASGFIVDCIKND